MRDNTPKTTPVEKVDGVFVKRDDNFVIAGIAGGKVRACWALATRGTAPPALGLITASARRSPQAQIVARLAQRLGIPARCHMPEGESTDEMLDVVAHGGTIVQHRAGYNNVLIARAMADAATLPGWRYIPFGMESRVAVGCTSDQVDNIPDGVRRIIIPVGSGMSAAGVLRGLVQRGRRLPVLGVRVGADPTKRLWRFGPFGWPELLTLVDVTGRIPYHTQVEASIGGIHLDPIYEAKCLEYVTRGDLLWVVGHRAAPDATKTKGAQNATRP